MLNHRAAAKHVMTLHTHFWGRVFLVFFILTTIGISFLYYIETTVSTNLKGDVSNLSTNKALLSKQLEDEKAQLIKATTEDQFVKNKLLQEEIKNIQLTYNKAATTYEKLLEFKTISKKTDAQDKLYAQSLKLLSQRNFASAETQLNILSKQMADETTKIVATFVIPVNVPVNNSPPGSGYSRQSVNAEIGTYLVDIISADLGSTRVIVDTASDSTCGNDCPVLSLGDYVSRSGGFAGVNGSYFCPASYPSCAGKSNSFDTLAMNKNKVYFNSDNNVYSTVPAVIFGSGFVRFVGRSQEWGRDTGVDGVLANQPLLLSGGNITFGGDGDPKKGGKGSRSFVASKGNMVYIGVVQNATVAEVAYVLKAMGMENALNLDSGGSTALWFGGYKAGPGRNIPNAIVFIRK